MMRKDFSIVQLYVPRADKINEICHSNVSTDLKTSRGTVTNEILLLQDHAIQKQHNNSNQAIGLYKGVI